MTNEGAVTFCFQSFDLMFFLLFALIFIAYLYIGHYPKKKKGAKIVSL